VLQTTAGRMIFGRMTDGAAAPAESRPAPAVSARNSAQA
jgi:hypothetical protein